MINFAAIFRGILLASAVLFLLAFAAVGFREASQQRAEQLARIAEAAHRPHGTNSIPMQGGWGCRAEAEAAESSDTGGPFSQTGVWSQ